METFIVLIPVGNTNSRYNCEVIENVTYELDNVTAYRILQEVTNDIEEGENENIEVESLTDFMDRTNNQEFNPENYFITYVHGTY